MTTLYLDPDDEITSAAARMRAVEDTRVALVLPAGSRVATSRINFRLLAREAQAHNRSLAIVTAEGSARALAASAGLPVFATVGEYEDALALGSVEGVDQEAGEAADEPAARPAAAGSAPPVRTSPGAAAGGPSAPAVVASATSDAMGNAAGAGSGRPGAATGPAFGGGRAATSGAGAAPAALSSMPREPAAGPAHERAGGPARPADDYRPAASDSGAGSRRRVGLAILLAFLALVVIVGGVAGYLLLPNATIVIEPRTEPVGPATLTVRADPAVSVADPSQSLVPAQQQPFPVQAAGQFNATGKKVDETKATGAVQWTNCDPTRAYTIPGGTTVKTTGGVAFTTDEPVLLPVAGLTFVNGQPQLTCQHTNVTVTAAAAGTAGNVDAATITQIPPAYNSNVIRLTNPAATTGGTHTETLLVAKADVDAAVASLRKQLDQALLAAVNAAAESGLATTVFPETRSLGDISYSPDPTTFVGQQITSFSLAANATGLATAVDVNAVKELAADHLMSTIGKDEELVPGSIAVSVNQGRVSGTAVVFPVTANGLKARKLDTAAIREEVKGKTLADARQILASYGTATIDLSPGWASTIPTFDFRLDIRVSPLPSASPSPAASMSPSVPPSGGSSPGSASTSAGSSPSVKPTARPSPSATPSPS